MKWSKELPNKKGYYWHKDASMDTPVVLFVREYNGGWYAQDEEYSFVVGSDDGEWCYIPEPE
jgi:hypothetical protein